MCGFSGEITFLKDDSCELETLKLMGEALKYRGPDDESIYQDDNLSIVFRRLSIIDVAGGAQPIWNEDKTILIVVNGEIYNHLELREKLKNKHEFRSNSDSEVVLHLYEEYGEETFSFLNGMFSIVIWDLAGKTVTIARDRLGIKPLYIAEVNGKLLFASELKALLLHPSCPRDVNWADLGEPGLQDKSLVSSYVVGVNHFPAGCYAKFSANTKLQFVNYWDLEFSSSADSEHSLEYIVEGYYKLLEDSVKKRLMSDVPVGIFLSGGVDSSIIAAIAAKYSKEINCFTVVEKNSLESGDLENAKRVSDTFGLNFCPIVFDVEKVVAGFNLSEFEKMIYLIESPRFDLEWFYKSELHKAAKKHAANMKVILIGQGADEFAGGYSNYLGSNCRDWQDYIRLNISPALARSKFQSLGAPSRFQNYFNWADNSDNENDKLAPYHFKMKNFIFQLQFFNLWHEDRTSSFYGMESRVPFLDHRLVEYLAKIPEHQHEELFWDKGIVRKVLPKVYPDYPVNHPKVPFIAAENQNLLNRMAKIICKNVFPSFVEKYKKSKTPLKKSAFESLYIDSQKNNAQSAEAAWQLIELMSLVIFEQFCQNPLPLVKSSDHTNDAAYVVEDANNWEGFLASASSRVCGGKEFHEWRSDTVINIPEDSEILVLLTENENVTDLILMNQGRQCCRLQVPDVSYWVVEMLEQMGHRKSDPQNISYWAEKVGVGLQDIVNVLGNLTEGGLIIKAN